MLKWLFRWKTVRGFLISLLWFAIFIGLFYVEENWRGKRVWERYRRACEAKGDRFEWSGVAPPPVPDSENFAAIPLFTELFPKPSGNPRLLHLQVPDNPSASGDWHRAKPQRFGVWREEVRRSKRRSQLKRGLVSSLESIEEPATAQVSFTTTNVLTAISQYDETLREVAAASRLPKCRFPIRYEDNFAALLPHLAPMRDLARLYRIRSLALLAEGRTDAALQDILTCVRLADKLADEPLGMSLSVRMNLVDLIIQPVWEGAVTHRWRAEQLVQLQAEFEKIDLLAHWNHVLCGERACTYQTISWITRQPVWKRPYLVGGLTSDATADLDLRLTLMGLAPSGWFFQNAVSVDRFYVDTVAAAVNQQQRRVYPKQMQRANELSAGTSRNPYQIMVRVFVNNWWSALVRQIATYQTSADQAYLACALERYRLVYDEYPEQLNALVPEFLGRVPHDLIDGHPLRYHRTANGQFVLYSVGWNELDDGGTIATSEWKPHAWKPREGDWVWQFPEP